MTITKQIADDIFKTSDSSFENRVNSATKKFLLQKIEFVEAEHPYSLNLNQLKSKYVLLSGSLKRDKMNGVKNNGEVKTIEGIPRPKSILFPPEKLELLWRKSGRVGAGLVNLGNTCFLNSALQCLTYTPPLANYLMSNQHRAQCRVNGQFCMLCSLQHHQSASFGNGGKSIRPMNILKNLRIIAKHLQFGRQEDAHEFIRYSVDAMQRSCLFGLPSKLDIHTKTTTLVYQIFGGYLRSRVKCRQCRAVSDTFDPFLDLSLDINKQESNDLRKCLENFVKPELLHGDNLYKCYQCKKSVPASKTFSIHRPPNVLTVQLKRFSSFMGNKINRDITYPSKLNLGPYTSSDRNEGPIYDLYAVLVHSGFSCNSGHYYAYAKAANGQWYCFNDSSVNQVSSHQALNQQAYLLFYHRVAETKHVKLKQKLNQREAAAVVKNHVNNRFVDFNGNPTKIKGNPTKINSNPTKINGNPTKINGNPTKINGNPTKINGNPTKINGNSTKIHGNPTKIQGDSHKPEIEMKKESPTKPSTPQHSCTKVMTTTNKTNGFLHKVSLKLPDKSQKDSKEIKTSEEKPALIGVPKLVSLPPVGEDWLESKIRERRDSGELGRSGNKKISFNIRGKLFSGRPNHQKMWQKLHVKKRCEKNEDERSLSSNDSRRSDKEREEHEKKLKMLGGSDKRKRRMEEEGGRSGILTKLLKLSSGRAYGGEVETWDGGSSIVEEDAKMDHHKRSRSSTDGWDREFDRGKIKKKKKVSTNINLFQTFQRTSATL
nr:ubiquitin carboxyl-terminal hydrolase 36 [Ciona intestinalis]|eukprot:XP_002127053.1 ubiquitin carboxyl-terminal hydrolase 36 [Ciona intestinalis]